MKSRREDGFIQPVIHVLVLVFLSTIESNHFGTRHGNDFSDGRRCPFLVEAFSSVPQYLSPFSSLRAQSTEHTGLGDCYSSVNSSATIHVSDLISVLSDAEFMDAETKRCFLASISSKISDMSNMTDSNNLIDRSASQHVTSTTDAKAEERSWNKIETNATRIIDDNAGIETNTFGIPIIEGQWEDHGGKFHASGAWQTTPLFMKGAFIEDIHNFTNDESYPFPSWNDIISLACDRRSAYDDQRSNEDSSHDVDLERDQNDDGDGEYKGDEYDGNTHGYDYEYGSWDGYSDDEEDFEDDEGGLYPWENNEQYQEDEDDIDNPPSRLIQYWWPRQDDFDQYHDVNINWLDTFEIKQFGPFNDPDSLKALLRTNEESNVDRHTARTLLVNDVDRWFPKLSDWMDRRFNSNNSNGSVLPARWRRDDAQISLSHSMGGIGPHVDDYDVFLIQLDGERTWDVLWEDRSCDKNESGMGVTDHDPSKISVRDETDCILPESSKNGVRILNITKLQSLQAYRSGKIATRLTRLHLRPGDCLYLPPRVLHCGTATNTSPDCMTLSVGCRAPSAMELLDGLSDLMKKSATTSRLQRLATEDLTFPSNDVIQAFHRRYTNTEIHHEEIDGNSLTENSSCEDANYLNITSSLSQTSWLSPLVKNEIKDLILTAVKTALDDDENILDPLVGKFVTKSNRLESDDFGPDDTFLQSFSYPKALREMLHYEKQLRGEGEDRIIDVWQNATSALKEVFGTQESDNKSQEPVLRRAEGIAFAWSSIDDKERRNRKYRLYAQGRPPFEVRETLHGAIEENETGGTTELFVSAPKSEIGRLMDRIANGPPLNKDFVVDELKITIEINRKGSKHSVTRLLNDLVEEGLLYGGYSHQ